MDADELLAKIDQYWRLRRELEQLDQRREELDSEITELEAELPDDFSTGDEGRLGAADEA